MDRAIPLARIEVMALVRVSEVAGLSGEPIGAELGEALQLLRRQGGLRWVAAALTMAAVAHEADSRPEVAARLLGGAGRVAELLAEDPLPLAPLAAVALAMRHRIDAALGAAASAAAEAAGDDSPYRPCSTSPRRAWERGAPSPLRSAPRTTGPNVARGWRRSRRPGRRS